MATFVLIPGAASDPSYWRFLSAELAACGHDAVAVDLPCEDDGAGLDEYVEAVIDAVGERTDLVLVGHSMGGFTAALAASRLPVRMLVFASAMIPAPDETVGQWWGNTGQQAAFAAEAARVGFDPSDDVAYFYNGVPSEVVADEVERGQSSTPTEQPWPLPALPDVPTRVVLFRDDRLFPEEFMRRVVQERLGIEPDAVGGGHMAMLSHAPELADRLASYLPSS